MSETSTPDKIDPPTYQRLISYLNTVIWIKVDKSPAKDKGKILFMREVSGRLCLPHVYTKVKDDIMSTRNRLFKDVIHSSVPESNNEWHLYVHTPTKKICSVTLIQDDLKLPPDENKPGDLLWIEVPMNQATAAEIEPWCHEMLTTLLTPPPSKEE